MKRLLVLPLILLPTNLFARENLDFNTLSQFEKQAVISLWLNSIVTRKVGGGFGGGDIANPTGFPNGTAAAPSIYWTADNDGSGTGFFRKAANEITASANGSEIFHINGANVWTDSGIFNCYGTGASPCTVYTAASTFWRFQGTASGDRFAIALTPKVLADNTVATFATETLGVNTGGGGTIHYCVKALDATTQQLECGSIDVGGVDVTSGAGGETCPNPTKVGTPLQVLSALALTVTFTATTGTDLCNLRVTADTTIAAPTSITLTWSVHGSDRVFTPQ